MQKFLAQAAAAGGALLAYSLYEPYRFRLTHKAVPARPGSPSLTVLHISDSHLTAGDRARLRFLTEIPDLAGDVDVVVMTGDMIEDDGGIDPLLQSLNGYRARYGMYYVLGSHDYYQAKFKAPTKYFVKKREPVKARRADVERLEGGLARLGWTALTNTTARVELENGGTMRLAGVDDPYLKRARTGHIERSTEDRLAIGLTHAPDVISDYALSGFDLIVAGHTHGGQVRFPFVGALVTNSSLPAALAAGLHRVGGAHLHVTPGLGASRFTPIRFLCPPEATVLHVRPDERAT